MKEILDRRNGLACHFLNDFTARILGDGGSGTGTHDARGHLPLAETVDHHRFTYLFHQTRFRAAKRLTFYRKGDFSIDLTFLDDLKTHG